MGSLRVSPEVQNNLMELLYLIPPNTTLLLGVCFTNIFSVLYFHIFHLTSHRTKALNFDEIQFIRFFLLGIMLLVSSVKTSLPGSYS